MRQINIEKLESNIQLILKEITYGTLHSLNSLKEISEVSQWFESDQNRFHSMESLQAFKLCQGFLKQIMVVSSPQGENICHQLIKRNTLEELREFLESLHAHQSVQERLLLSINKAGYSPYALVFAIEDPELIQQVLRVLSPTHPEAPLIRDGNWKDAVWWSIIKGNTELTKKLLSSSYHSDLTKSERLDDYSALGLSIFCKTTRQLCTQAINIHTQLDNLITQMAIGTVNGVDHLARNFPVDIIHGMSRFIISQSL